MKQFLLFRILCTKRAINTWILKETIWLINQFNILLLFLITKNIRLLLPIMQIMTYSSITLLYLGHGNSYSQWSFPCWSSQCSNIFQRVFILFSTFIRILKSDKAIPEKLVLLPHTEDVIQLKYMRKIIKIFAVKSCFSFLMVLTEKQTLNYSKIFLHI